MTPHVPSSLFHPFWVQASCFHQRSSRPPCATTDGAHRKGNAATVLCRHAASAAARVGRGPPPRFAAILYEDCECAIPKSCHPPPAMAKTRNDGAHCCHRPDEFQEGPFKLFFFHMVTDTITWGNQTINNGITHSVVDYNVICYHLHLRYHCINQTAP